MKGLMLFLAMVCAHLPYGCEASEFRELVSAMQMSAEQHLECATKYSHYEAEMFYWKGQVDAYTLVLLVLDDCESCGGHAAGDR